MIDHFIVLDAKADYDEWLRIFNNWELKEPFAHPAYCSLFSNFKTDSKCAILMTDNGGVIYPFLLRDIQKEEYATNINAKDIISAYGYAGMYKINLIDNFDKTVLEKFRNIFQEWAISQSVISEVVKFHLFNEVYTEYDGNIESPQHNISVDLLKNIDIIWKNFDHKVRKNVNKALASNLTLIIDPDGTYFEDFLSIYNTTLNRRAALETYYFTESFFKKIINNMNKNFCFFHVLNNNKIISTELCLISKNNIYSFLGGTNSDFFHLRPNDFLKFEIIKWGLNNNKKRFILGGGYEKNDGIFNYKKSFDSSGIYNFNIGTKIFDIEKYNNVIKSKINYHISKNESWNPQYDFIPTYRL
jgi:lipid II:glycine glycyltransferase (peptidoglycan interpeptide bridge formation enzyme)